ncbi:MAG: hypothetical protein CMM91_10885 [Rickettsiales bacterium]|nr:hypothetical protein [Rickettsiales bacterium]OUV52970.1 MAG: hypothetical protein CBC87_06370 [Rickettsiales bacterium TMED127]|tara:strand:- start:67230 stop:67520 length:291 start_codon:yes stop_codon:yes gene_type:complete
MLNSLKKIVITLAFLIIILLIIVVYTVFTRLNIDKEAESLKETDLYNYIDIDLKVISFEIENNLLYLHLSNDKNDLIKIIDLSDGKTIKTLNLRYD